MRSFSTLLTASTLATSLATVSEALTFVAAERTGDKHPDILPKPSDSDLFRQRSGVECQNEQVCVLACTVSKGRDPSNVCNAVALELREDVFFFHVAKFRSENRTLAGVATMVEGDNNLLAAESGSLQESFRVSARIRFQDKSAVGGSLNFNIAGTTDSGDLFCWPENVDLAE
jgi:hypothetical protein